MMRWSRATATPLSRSDAGRLLPEDRAPEARNPGSPIDLDELAGRRLEAGCWSPWRSRGRGVDSGTVLRCARLAPRTPRRGGVAAYGHRRLESGPLGPEMPVAGVFLSRELRNVVGSFARYRNRRRPSITTTTKMAMEFVGWMSVAKSTDASGGLRCACPPYAHRASVVFASLRQRQRWQWRWGR